MLVSVLWIWPGSRRPLIWFSIFFVCMAVTTAWLGLDLGNFLATQRTAEKVGTRLLFKLLTATEWPVLQLMSGCLVCGIISRRYRNQVPESGGESSTYRAVRY